MLERKILLKASAYGVNKKEERDGHGRGRRGSRVSTGMSSSIQKLETSQKPYPKAIFKFKYKAMSRSP